MWDTDFLAAAEMAERAVVALNNEMLDTDACLEALHMARQHVERCMNAVPLGLLNWARDQGPFGIHYVRTVTDLQREVIMLDHDAQEKPPTQLVWTGLHRAIRAFVSARVAFTRVMLKLEETQDR